MERRWVRQDRGQAFPIYIVVIAALLFAALAFFVIGQASVTRSDAQGAADAAALAAAQDTRDHLLPGMVLAELQPKDWEAVLAGNRLDSAGACGKASDFAESNGATASCTADGLSFKVAVSTERTVGNSVIPGTNDMKGTADATAVIEPRCHLGAAVPPAPTPTPTPAASSSSSPEPSPGETSPPKPSAVKFLCKGGKEITFDPTKPDPWRTVGRALFDVRLTD
ncbi:pilus assembly protein TadG-related protein [Streptomyces sp. NPDC127110]|uniref:pilus assembly protein TadG-related protein n=1 Tax=Streptomyces sp. NPDC127110 TaxID=3345362 RepID=UPI003629E0E6